MADSYIKGITVEIGGNTDKLDKAVSNVNKTISNTTKNLSEINKQLKFSDGAKSVELLTQKQGQLAKAIEEAKQKVEAYRQAQEQAQKALANGDIGQETYDELTRKLMAAETQVMKFENELKNTNDALEEEKQGADQAGTAIKEQGDSAAEASKKNSKLGEIAKAAAVSLAAIATAATAAAIKMGKAVIESYGEFEQLVGGVETLFGAGGLSMEEYAAKTGKTVDEISAEYNRLIDAEETVLSNADDAYKTAGLSANEYMEQVTAFSAALISSLDGDSRAAAEKANQAIIDMSDNANKMGSDISSIQSAYQGFAKQQYTLLDNLKLGYGGTKTEMERLLADAEKFSGIKYDISSYSDIIDAIHVIQTEMGITGTTAKEAEETIQGSIAMTQAAWENFVTSLGSGAGVDEAINELTESALNVISNIQPVIERLAAAIPIVVRALIPIIMDMLPTLIQTALDLIGEIFVGIIQALPSFITAIVTIVDTLWNSLKEAIVSRFPEAEAIFDQVEGRITGWMETISNVISTVWGAIQDFWNEYGEGILQTTKTVFETIYNVVQTVIIVVQTILHSFNTQTSDEWNKTWTSIKDFLSTTWQTIRSIVESVSSIINSVITIFLKYIQAIWENNGNSIMHTVQVTWEFIKALIQTVTDLISGILKVFEAVLRGDWEAAWNAVKEVFATTWDNIKTLLSNSLELIKSIYDTFMGIFITLVQTTWNNVKDKVRDAWDGIKDIIKGVVDSAVNWGRDLVDNFVDGIKQKWNDLKDAVSDIAETVSDYIGFSEPKKGPLSDFHTYAPDMLELFAKGIHDNMSIVSNQMNSLASEIGGGVQRTANFTMTTPVYLDGKVVATVVNQQLGVML